MNFKAAAAALVNAGNVLVVRGRHLVLTARSLPARLPPPWLRRDSLAIALRASESFAMPICSRLFVFSTAVLVIAGCGGGGSPAESTASTKPKEGATPQAALITFLEAVRIGDDKKASELLTDIAREKTTEMNMLISPPGSKTASYEVGEVEVVPGGAHVAASWSDLDEQGAKHTDTIVWILREEPQGWRIAGMATKLFNDLPPLVLNFEDPQDMLRKQALAEQEMQRRMSAATDPAGQKAAAAVQNAEAPTNTQLK
ncbi:MAG TPA: hypothetical protein VG713_19675 [Pirellulales bacterium]|nr:hypothetical protein [Pirellulales bacterium]